MLNYIKTFTAAEDGAVTVDWVVLTAALVGLGLAVMGVVSGGIGTMSENISTTLSERAIDCNPLASADAADAC